MRIVFLQSSLWLSGGGRVVVEYANRLSRRGHQVSIVIPKDTVSEELDQVLDPSVEVRQASRPLVKPISVFNQVRLALSMVRAVPKCDVIVTTHTPTTIVSLVAGALLKRGVPVWFFLDYMGMFADRPVEAWLFRYAMRWHKSALLISSYLEKELANYGRKKCYQVGLGLSDVDVFKKVASTKRHLIDPQKKRIFYLGDFRPRKGFADFLKASEIVYKQLPDIELWIALKEPGEVKSSVPFTHFYRPSIEQLAELYTTCNLYVSASWHEGFGLPPLEAMTCGAPVVVTNSGGVQDYVRDGENCLLVPPRNPEALADAMISVLTNSELEAKLRSNGPSTASEFTWDKAVQRFELALLDSINT